MGTKRMLARVFPRKTKMSPTGQDVYFSPPPLFPKYDEVRISVTFTWDIKRGIWLKKQWEVVCNEVKIGGPAFEDPGAAFAPGEYLKRGAVITSRGCPNHCRHCLVPEREGKLRELPIVVGNKIMDNNLFACSRTHIDRVFDMLKKQGPVVFSGGLDATRLNDYIIERLRGVSLECLYLAFDTESAERSLIKAVTGLRRGVTRRRSSIACYVLIGWEGNGTETIEKAEQRLIRAWEIGTMPYAMLYQPNSLEKKKYSLEWKKFQRKWIRPAIIRTRMKEIVPRKSTK